MLLYVIENFKNIIPVKKKGLIHPNIYGFKISFSILDPQQMISALAEHNVRFGFILEESLYPGYILLL